MLSAGDALKRLREGNRRFASNTPAISALTLTRRDELIGRQEPFAIVLGCSDSRVPAEMIFDQGLGDLFVIRVAGNVVAPSGVGSVEFAAARFGTRLVVVLGHSGCGAVAATIEESPRPPNFTVNRTRAHGVNFGDCRERPFLVDTTVRSPRIRDHASHAAVAVPISS